MSMSNKMDAVIACQHGADDACEPHFPTTQIDMDTSAIALGMMQAHHQSYLHHHAR